jgi:polysaccharide export outer membrane protein
MRNLLLFLAVALRLAAADPDDIASYVLGPEDQVSVTVLDLDEIKPDPVRVDVRGNISLPLVGRLRATGLTVEQLEIEIAKRLKSVLQDPQVNVTVQSFRSQPVSVLGAVKTPGVHQVTGKKSLYEVLSLAGGLNPDAGNMIKITRKKTAGPLPLPNVADDVSGQYRIAELNVRGVMEAKNPQDNITVLPDDVISVPKADLVYVIGAVRKSGGFILSEREKISVLQALSLAEGLERTASAKKAKILRQVAETDNRTEILIDVKLILEGKGKDVALTANDILFIPTNGAKNVAMRGVEAALQVGTGIAIYRR